MKKILLPLVATLLLAPSAYAKTLNLGHAMSLESAAHQGMVIMAEKVKSLMATLLLRFSQMDNLVLNVIRRSKW